MRVATESDRELVLVHRPIVIPVVVMILVVAVVVQWLQSPTPLNGTDWVGPVLGSLVGILIAYLVSLPSRVVFDTTSHEVRWHHFGWPGNAEGSCSLDDLTGIEVVSVKDGGVERIVLLTGRGAVPLTRDFFGFHRQHQTVDTIRTWLRDHGIVIAGAE